jgi:hypothetical protein
MPPPTLRELQRRLRRLIAEPQLDRPEVLAAELAALGIRDDRRLSATARLEIYAEMYFVRLRDALAHDYPALERSLGADAFAMLARRYLDAHPSDRPSLRDLGRHLPAFASRRPDLLQQRWQAELAQLEWAMVEAFDAREQPTLRAADLAALPSEAWPDVRIATVASLVLLACETPVDVLRERILAGEEPAECPNEPVLLRVWRQDTTVFHRRMDTVEAAALRWIFRGVSFAELCAWLGESAHEQDPATTALRLLHRWLDDEVLVAPA